jgi:hypothetical protein
VAADIDVIFDTPVERCDRAMGLLVCKLDVVARRRSRVNHNMALPSGWFRKNIFSLTKLRCTGVYSGA